VKYKVQYRELKEFESGFKYYRIQLQGDFSSPIQNSYGENIDITRPFEEGALFEVGTIVELKILEPPNT